jgi:hypothetical protein
MARPSKQIMSFMEKYGVESDEIWEVHGSTWVVKHKALERIAAEQGVTWDRPAMLECNSADGVAAMCVFGKLGERMEWSVGECLVVRPDRAGGNYKVTGKQAGYVYAMAEKRAKDRVILKLLDTAGALYSEAESDEFTQRQNPHVTRPEDIVPGVDYDDNGQIIDNIPHAQPAQKLRVADQRPLYDAIQKEAHAFGDSARFVAWMNDEKTIARVADFKQDWQAIFRGVCKEHLAALRTQEQGDNQRDMRMAG